MALPAGFTASDTIVNYSLAVVITASDTVNLPAMCRAIYVGVTGDITAIMSNGDSVLFKAVPVGIFPIRATRIMATGTGAASLIALY